MKYIPTIGIETHVQLKTKTKLFAAVDNNAREAAPNSLISHICVGMPGALPVLNQGAIDLACRAAFALNTEPQKFSKFDRKHYFYPDLPKGYQISQFEQPIILGGFVEINVNGQTRRIGITRAHLEEDAGKNTHPDGAEYSLVDLNRAGTPLLEIVSEPEIRSAAEAKAYVRELYLLMKYADVSDVDMYHGNLRFDVNISLSSNNQLGTRTEIKNLNSFRSVEASIEYEIKRQTEILEASQLVVQETLGWDEASQKTTSQRGKEEAQDYRYMPEPDVPPVVLSDEQIENYKRQLPELPDTIREKLAKIGVDNQVVEDLLDNEGACKKCLEAITANVDPENVRRIAFDSLEEPETLRIKLQDHVMVADKLKAKLISSNSAKEILLIKANDENADIEELLKSKEQVSDEAEIEKIVAEVLAQNEKAAADVKSGEMKAIGFLVGQVMAKSQGKANPSMAQQIIKKQLGI